MTDKASATTTYTYDQANRLTQAVKKNWLGQQQASYAYGYDHASNLTSITTNGTGTGLTYNAANELTQATGGISRTYSYDANGDLISRSDGMSITMNAQDQVASITPGGGSAIAMTYTGPGEGERVKAGSTGYQFDGSGMSLQLPQGQSPITYTTTPDGGIISETLPGGTAPCPSGTTPCTYDYLSDGQGNVAGVTDTAGTQLLDSYSYDPLGTITAQTSGVPNAFTFQGWMYDASTGLYYMGAAGYYDPSVGMQTGCKDGPGDAPSGTEDFCGEDEGNAREDFLGGGRS